MSQKEPQLAPPGAGIPFLNRMALRLYVIPFVASKTPWDESKKRFRKITAKILQEVEGLSEEQMSRKVLVPPQRGLEDSSRYWSVAMTLEHLGIVGRGIRQAVEALTHDQVPQVEVNIALVKPHGRLNPAEALNDFKKFALEEFETVNIGDRSSPLKLKHPWFGPLNAQCWYWLMAVHQGIHWQQIRAIKKGLGL